MPPPQPSPAPSKSQLIEKARAALRALRNGIDLRNTPQAEILMGAVASSLVELYPLEKSGADSLSKVLSARKASLGLSDSAIDHSENLEYLIALTTYDEGGADPQEYNPAAARAADDLFQALDAVLADLDSSQGPADAQTPSR